MQVFYGSRGYEYYTGVVARFDATHAHTVEGNTVYSSGAVLERTYGINDSRITSYAFCGESRGERGLNAHACLLQPAPCQNSLSSLLVLPH